MGFFGNLLGRKEVRSEAHIDIAERALRAGDPSHAASHLGKALLGRHDRGRMETLVASLASSSAGYPPDQYASLAGDGPIAADRLALRTALLAHRGEYDKAFQLLVRLVEAVPTFEAGDWMTAWMADPRFGEVNPLVLAASLQRALKDRPLSDDVFPKLLALARSASEAHPRDENLTFIAVTSLRRVDPSASAELAASIQRSRPSYKTAVLLYGSLRAAGDYDGALSAIDEALRFDTHDVPVRLDLADLLLELGRLAEALSNYEKVLESSPEHPWALPSARFLEAVRGDERSEATLTALAMANNERAVELLARLRGEELLTPGSATTDVVGKIAADLAKNRPPPREEPYTVKVALSCLEPPSARLAAEEQLQRYGAPIRLVVEVASVPNPDTRKPIRPVDFVLWEYEGTDPRPALGKPTEETRTAIGALAQTIYASDRWWERAGRIATASEISELLSVMVHPPAAPDGVLVWDWWFRVQVAAAFALARVRDARAREAALFSLARGPHDWSASAALIAIGEAVQRGELDLKRVFELFGELAVSRPNAGSWCVGDTLDAVVDKLEREAERAASPREK